MTDEIRTSVLRYFALQKQQAAVMQKNRNYLAYFGWMYFVVVFHC